MVQPDSILVCIHLNYHSSQFDVNHLAEYLSLSTSRLRDIVNVYYGISPQRLIEAIRMYKALELIENNFKSEFLCRELGFDCKQTFVRTFTRNFGLHPKEVILHQSTELKLKLESLRQILYTRYNIQYKQLFT